MALGRADEHPKSYEAAGLARRDAERVERTERAGRARRLHVAYYLLLTLSGCQRDVPAPPPPRPVVVFATVFPLADLARQVGGDAVRVDWLLDLGDPIDHYALSRRDRERMSGADLILVDGLGRTETWAAEQLARLRDVGNVISCETRPSAHDAPPDGLLYLDPAVAAETVDAITDALVQRLPGQTDAIRARAKACRDRIARQAGATAVAKGTKVLTLSAEFDPLLARVGVAAVRADADPLNLTDADAAMLRHRAASAGVRAVLVPFDTPPATVTGIEEGTGLRAYPIDPLGYPNYAGHASYADVLKYDLDELQLAAQH